MEIIKSEFENFLRSPNLENIEKFKKELLDTDDSIIHIYQASFLVPLLVKLDEIPIEKQSELKLNLMQCIKVLVYKTRIKNIDMMKTVLIATLKQIHNFKTGFLYDNLSEEIKVESILCVKEVFNRSDYETLEKFYTPENRTIIGKVAATCVDLIQKEKYRTLRVSAISCLQTLYFVHENADLDDIVFRNQVANTTFLFLPKIIFVLMEIVIGDEKVGQSLLTLAIKSLGDILCLVYEDDIHQAQLCYSPNDFNNLINLSITKNITSRTDEEILGNNLKTKKSEEKLETLKNIERNTEWFGASSRKLKPILSKISILSSNNVIKIRYEYAKFSCKLLEKCCINLHENVYTFLETIIAMSQDEDLQIRDDCQKQLKTFSQNQKEFTINWEHLFDTHIIRLPRIISRCEELEQIAEFLFLKGFFQNVPQDAIETIFSISGNLEKFCKCLIESFDMKLTQNLLTEEYALRQIDENTSQIETLPWRNYKNLPSARTEQILIEFCKDLGKSVIKNLIFDQLMAMIKSHNISNETILVIILCLTSNHDISAVRENTELIKNFLDEILDNKHWHLALVPDEINHLIVEKNSDWYVDRTPGLYESTYEVRIKDMDPNIEQSIQKNNDIVNIHDAQFNVLHTCLILDGLGHTAKVLKENFKPFIFKCLHRVLLMTGSSNYLIHKSGSYALNCIKEALNFRNITELIQHYADYISYHINISLKKCQHSNSAIDILAVVLRYSTLGSMAHLENIVLTILDELTKVIQSKNILSYLKVFHIFLINVQNWVTDSLKDIESLEEHGTNHNIHQDNNLETNLFEILNKDCNEVDINNVDIEETEQQDHGDGNNDPSEESIKPNLPKYISIVIEVLKKILKFISSKEQMNKVIALECVISGLPILNDYESELLPLVHLIWYPLCERFKDKDSVVLIRCFELLEVLSKCSKDFLHHRVLKDVIPFLNQFLKKSFNNSLQNINLSQTQDFKLQCKLLRGYSNLVTNMVIQQKQLEEITDSVIVYLSEKQPKLLQENAIEYFLQISKYNKPFVYVKLLYYKNNFDYMNNIKIILNKAQFL